MPRTDTERAEPATGVWAALQRRLFATAFVIPEFRSLWAAQVFRGLVVWMQSLTLPWLMLQAGGSALDVGAAGAVQFLPSAVLSPLVGAALGTSDKRRLLLATQSVTALTTLGLLVAVSVGYTRLPVYLAALAFGLVGAVDNPARHALVGQLVPGRLVTSAVGLNATIFSVTRVVGPSVAALLIVGVGVPFTLALMAAASLAGVSLLRRLQPDVVGPPDGRSTRLGDAFRDGLAYVGSSAARWMVLASLAISVIVVGAVQAVLPTLVIAISPADPPELHATTLGLMLTVVGLGALTGGVLFGFVASTPSLRASMAASVSMSLAVVATSLVEGRLVILATLGLYGFLGTVAVTMLNGRLQRATDDVYRARVMSLYVAVYALATAAGSVVGGLAAEVLRPATALAAIGLAGAGIGIALLLRARAAGDGARRTG